MRTFDEIEEKDDGRLAVQLVGDMTGSGQLTLDREKTLLTLTTPALYHPKADINGWFDIKLRHGNQGILLRNALFRSQTDHGTRRQFWETSVFPNFVILNSDALDKNGRVRHVIFRIEKFEDFFIHHVVEHQFLHDAPKEVYRSLKKLRRNKLSKQFPVQYDFHKPSSVYLVHLPPRILAFDTLGNHYELHWGSRWRGMGWDGIDLKAEPFGIIKFGEPKTIDEALDDIWIWKRLFCQLAMERLELTTVSGRGVSKQIYADVYMPHSKRRNPKAVFDHWAFRRGDAPFSLWKDRKKLGVVMGEWMRRDKSRHTFRANVDRVVANLRKGPSLEDVVTLCSAVESLDELKSPKSISDKELDAIADAAIQGAKDAGIVIDSARVKGVLALLKHQSLPQRLRSLMGAIAPQVSPAHAKTIMKGVLSLRTVAAHGGSMASLSIPRVTPVVTALAGCCVLYDLLTSGFPAKVNDHSKVRASRKIAEALDWIAHLEQQSKATAKPSPSPSED